jgi:hypothetical protein
MTEDNFAGITPDEAEEANALIKEAGIIIEAYTPGTDAELNEIAKQLYRNEIFVSWQIHDSDINLMKIIFMPLFFMDEHQIIWMQDNDITTFFASYHNQAPRSINGYPTFFSLQMLNKEDTDKVYTRYQEILELMGESHTKEQQVETR